HARVFRAMGPCPAVGLEDLIEGPAPAWERAESALDHPDDAAERDIAGHERVHRLLVGRVQDRRVSAALAGRLASQADAGKPALVQLVELEPAEVLQGRRRDGVRQRVRTGARDTAG